MILVIDHYDSFAHNLARTVTLAGGDVEIHRCDALSIGDIRSMTPEAIILSPGPCTPQEAGISVELVRILGVQIPILGVCLGHQCIGAAYDANIVRSAPVHGQASRIQHSGTGIFAGLPPLFEGGRYHSLSVEIPENSPLVVTARSEDGIIMGLAHKTNPVYGVQFHPESILTPCGLDLIRNFTALAARGREAKAA